MNKEYLYLATLKSTQTKLKDFLNRADYITGNDIREWISECVVHFTEVGVPQNIVTFFIERLEYKDTERRNPLGLEFSGEHGPFVYESGRGYVISEENRLVGQKGGHVKITPILVAFSVAQKLIDKFENEATIVPKNLIEELGKYNETKSASHSLRSFQSAFEAKNTKAMLISLISATDVLFKLIPELSDKKDLGPKIKKAYDESAIYEKYSLQREILWSINNARIIRNIDVHQPESNNNITLYEAVSYGHLLYLLILSLLSSGQISLSEFNS